MYYILYSLPELVAPSVVMSLIEFVAMEMINLKHYM